MPDFRSIREQAEDGMVLEPTLSELLALPLDQQMRQPAEVRQRLAAELRRQSDLHAAAAQEALQRLLSRQIEAPGF